MTLVKKLKESLAQFAGEPNVIVPDMSNDLAGNYFIINVFNNLLRMLSDSLTCVGAEVSEGQIDVVISDGEKETLLTFFDEDGVPYLYVSDFNAESEEEIEIEDAYDISDLKIFDGKDFDFSKLDYRLLDYFTEIVDEATITVIRGGKKVKKLLKRKKRRKPLSAKKRLGIRKAVLKRKRTQRAALRKRQKSNRIRNRSKLKKKPKNFRI